jgi:hypothetical protein
MRMYHIEDIIMYEAMSVGHTRPRRWDPPHWPGQLHADDAPPASLRVQCPLNLPQILFFFSFLCLF